VRELAAFWFIYGGFLVALVGIVVGTVVIMHSKRTRASHRPRSLAVQVLGMLAAAALAGIIGMYAGFGYFCSPGSGAQCGLGGVFITGPIAFGIGALAYAVAFAVWDIELR
jgi:hypothetical protein